MDCFVACAPRKDGCFRLRVVESAGAPASLNTNIRGQWVPALGREDAGETPDSNFKQQKNSRGAECARVVLGRNPRKTEGAGKTGCALHPRSRVQDAHSKTHTSIQVQRKHSGLPCAMVLTVSFALSSVSRACLPPSPADKSANLTPASGCQDHTTSPSASVSFVRRAIHAPNTFASIASRAQRP
jgi:hypothetical protein